MYRRVTIKLAVAIQLIVGSIHAQQQCSSSFTVMGFKLHDLVFKTILDSSQGSCLTTCTSHKTCRSINYQHEQKQCELNQGNHLTHPEYLKESHGFVYVDNDLYQSLWTSYCSNNLCSKPLACVIKGNGYDCIPCNQVSGSKELLIFPRKSIDDKVEWEHAFSASLTAFTLSLWVQMNPVTKFHSAFSYAYTGEDNGLCIHVIDEKIQLNLRGTFAPTDLPLIDGNWHHIAWTWQNSDGKWKLYINGTKRSDGNLHVGQTIPKGAVILGQDPDSYMGKYDSSQALQGTLAMVNMWDKVLTTEEVAVLHSNKCSTAQGNIVKWDDLVKRRSGQVELSCSRSFCS